jgi:uncharacterized protein (DUF362 family)
LLVVVVISLAVVAVRVIVLAALRLARHDVKTLLRTAKRQSVSHAATHVQIDCWRVRGM